MTTNGEPDDFAGMMAELLEAQRAIDAVARSTVEGVRRVADEQETLTPGGSSEFARKHRHFYDGTERELAALGFRSLGDYEPSGQEASPAAQRAFYRFALSTDGTIGAQWFVLPSDDPLACLIFLTWLGDGRSCVTGRGVSGDPIPRPPQILVQHVDDSLGASAMLRAHRDAVARSGGAPRVVESIDALLAARHAEAAAVSEWRKEQGLALFEPMLRASLGDAYEEQGEPILQSILTHPEWWTGDEPDAGEVDGGGDAEDGVRLMVFRSVDEDSGRSLFTTFGMLMHGLPEFQMRGVAANHCRAAKFLIATVAPKWAKHIRTLAPDQTTTERWRVGFDLNLTPEDVPPGSLASGTSATVSEDARGPVTVRLSLSTLPDGDPDTELLNIGPADAQPTDTWLREACRRLGLDVPGARPFDHMNSAMQEASRSALARLPEVRARWTIGFPAGYGLVIKTGLPDANGGTEYVWVRVNEWTESEVVGALENQPNHCPGYERGQKMRVAEPDIFDYAIFVDGEGLVEPSRTDIVALDYGLDLA